MNGKVLAYRLDRLLLGHVIRWVYPQYHRPQRGYMPYAMVLYQYAFRQKIIGHNRRVPWPVHFTSVIRHPERITKGMHCDPGDSPGVYINAVNGLIVGHHVEIGPGVVMVTANHDPKDLYQRTHHPPIQIGNHVWIGARAILLPGVQIGDHVIIGAGSVVTKDIPAFSVAVGNPCRVVRSTRSRFS